MEYLSNLSYSNSYVGSDHMAQPSLPTPINEPRLPMTLLLVPHCFFLGAFLINNDHSTLGTPDKSCSFGDPHTQSSSHHNLAFCSTFSNPYTCLFFMLLTTQLWGQHVLLFPNNRCQEMISNRIGRYWNAAVQAIPAEGFTWRQSGTYGYFIQGLNEWLNSSSVSQHLEPWTATSSSNLSEEGD